MLYAFHDHLVLEHRGWWFVWETAWDSFRPVDNVQWDGTQLVLDDKQYCSDPSNPHYGYGSSVMKDLCGLLADRHHDLPVDVDVLPLGTHEWMMDRRVALTPCAPRDTASWKRLTHGHHRTCRKAPKGQKWTRRASRSTNQD
jgi:hypothetical protein